MQGNRKSSENNKPSAKEADWNFYNNKIETHIEGGKEWNSHGRNQRNRDGENMHTAFSMKAR